jgi:CRP-like cAMP-binding protein
MSDPSNPPRNLRDRLSGSAEDRLGKALGELLESPLLTGALGRAFDAREKAAQAQEAALGALNLPSAADIERLTRRLRSVSQRLEGIEDGVARLDRAVPSNAMELAGFEQRLASIERQLATVIEKLDRAQQPAASAPAGAGAAKRTKKASRAAPSRRPKKA